MLFLLTFDFLITAGAVDCSIKDVLVFITGSDPTGFHEELSLSFKHSSDMFPSSSTRDLTLWLPTAHKSYKEFKDSIIWGVKGNDGCMVISRTDCPVHAN